MDTETVIEQYHASMDAFALGDPAPVKALYARSDDVLLANPFGGFSRGWDAVSQAIPVRSKWWQLGMAPFLYPWLGICALGALWAFRQLA